MNIKKIMHIMIMYLKTPNKYSIIAIATIAIVAAGLIAIPAMEQANALVQKKTPIQTALKAVKSVVKRILDPRPQQQPERR